MLRVILMSEGLRFLWTLDETDWAGLGLDSVGRVMTHNYKCRSGIGKLKWKCTPAEKCLRAKFWKYLGNKAWDTAPDFEVELEKLIHPGI